MRTIRAGVLRRDACRRTALAQVSGLVDRQARADQITRVIREARRRTRSAMLTSYAFSTLWPSRSRQPDRL